MKRYFISLLLIVSMVFGMGAACNKAKALATVRDADELAAKLLIYGRNIAAANNESFRQGNIAPAIHLTTNKTLDLYLKGVDIYIAGIATAKKAIEEGKDQSTVLDTLEALFNAEVVSKALALTDLIVTLPPALKDKLAGWGAAIQLAITSFKALFAAIRVQMEVNANA